jgi:probable F420-dependent oxidoreductase
MADTPITRPRPDLGRFGVFLGAGQDFGRDFTGRHAKDVEALGYGAVWVAGSPAADLAWVEPLLEDTSTLKVGTAIVNIWTADTAAVADSFHRIDAAHPGRFLLGIGAGHRELHTEYRKPLAALGDYLDRLDGLGVPRERRVVAALGPKVLALSAQRAAGAIPYLTTPDHAAAARAALGPDAFLAPEHKVVLSTDVEQARAAGRRAIGSIGKVNYRTNLQRLGFTDEDLEPPGSDRLVDALVAHGTTAAIADRLRQFHDAGADHVAVQALTPLDTLIDTLAELAAALEDPKNSA